MATANVLQELDELQRDVDMWHQRTSSDLQAMHAKFSGQIRALEDAILMSGGGGGGGGFALGGRGMGGGAVGGAHIHHHHHSLHHGHGMHGGGFGSSAAAAGGGGGLSAPGSAVKSSAAAAVGGLEWEALLTPSRTPQRVGGAGGAGGAGTAGAGGLGTTPSMASPPISHALNYDMLIDEAKHKSLSDASAARNGGGALSDAEQAALRSRPTPDQLPADSKSTPLPHDRNQPCQVLVEFKRKRILQFESPQYVAPGEYVVVAGDRGEDIGLVTHTWLVGVAPAPSGKWASGMGKVTRLATVLEVSQLQGVQTELEMRAVEVAQEKVVEHQLPMRIVDAEYQFDRKKLTFYYQSQHRLDFRNLVRDLYKTFRARIWMELD